jgi:hypothetical protein
LKDFVVTKKITLNGKTIGNTIKNGIRNFKKKILKHKPSLRLENGISK